MSVTDPVLHQPPLPRPPLTWPVPITLFLDFDGTLVELVERPDAVIVDGALHGLIETLAERLEGRVALVSGRSIEQIDGFLGTTAAGLMLAGSHGMEQRLPGVAVMPLIASDALAAASELFARFAEGHPATMVEHKTHGVALHYRQAPQIEAAAHALAEQVAAGHGLIVQPGKMMIEVREAGDDKGDAIRALMARPELAGTVPLFLGDDLTDEPGFVAVCALAGAGVLVGAPRPTAADFALRDVDDVRRWLAAFAGQIA
jgi:trehalose 6-phosphate phosphatase